MGSAFYLHLIWTFVCYISFSQDLFYFERAEALHASRTFHNNLIDREIQNNLNFTFEKHGITMAIPLRPPRESGVTLQGPTLRDPDVETAMPERWNSPDGNEEEDSQPPHMLPCEPKNKTGEPPPPTTSITSIVPLTPLYLYKRIPKQDNIDYEAEQRYTPPCLW